jgi:biotin carboxyl carrier protein
MHGRIVQIEAVDNDSVSAGQLLVIMEAMKMEHHLLAPSDTRIEQILVRAGDQVASGQILITLA